MKSAAPFVVALLAAIGFALPAAADPKLDDVAVVRDTSGRTVLLYPEPVHPLLLDLKSLEGQPFEFGGRDGAIGKATITAIAPDRDNIVSLDGLADAAPMVGFARRREWIKPLPSPPAAPIIAAVIAAQIRSLGDKGTLESATAWRANESDQLFLEVRTIVAGTKREDYNGNAVTALYMFRWTGHDWLLTRADSNTNYDGPEGSDVHVLAVARNSRSGLDVVVQWDHYEWEILEWYPSNEVRVRLCLGICS